MYLPFLFIVAIGLALGSFLGVVTRRLPGKESFVKGRSYCPRCKALIVWYDNIPVISFLLLKGKCRNCKKKISLRYPFIEAGTALGVIGIYLLRLPSPLLLLPIFLLTVAIFVIDLEKKIIPDELIFWGFGLTIVALLVGWDKNFYIHLVGGFIPALFLLLTHVITKGRGMGLGDVKYALFAGTFLGWPLSLTWLFLAFLTGASVGVILILAGKAKWGRHIAFGPFLALSFLITYLFGSNFILWLIG